MVKEVDRVEITMTFVINKLQEHGYLEYLHIDCSVCEMEPDYCDKLKNRG